MNKDKELKKHMGNFLLAVLGLIVVLKTGLCGIKFLLFKKHRKNLVLLKLKKIMSNFICRQLDKVLVKQEIKKAAVVTQQQPSKVVPIAKYTKQSKAK